MTKNKKKKKKIDYEKEFGYRSFYCKPCDVEFEVSWTDIFELQEMTHGYVGYENNDVYIACPKCGEIVNLDDHKNDDKNVALHPDFNSDSDIPF